MAAGLLTARILVRVGGVNRFDQANQDRWTVGDTHQVYVQLWDEIEGKRYMPAAGSALQVTLDDIDDAVKVTRSASQPFALDPSIWTFAALPGDTIQGTIALRLQLTESGVVYRGSVEQAFLVNAQGAP